MLIVFVDFEEAKNLSSDGDYWRATNAFVCSVFRRVIRAAKSSSSQKADRGDLEERKSFDDKKHARARRNFHHISPVGLSIERQTTSIRRAEGEGNSVATR